MSDDGQRQHNVSLRIMQSARQWITDITPCTVVVDPRRHIKPPLSQTYFALTSTANWYHRADIFAAVVGRHIEAKLSQGAR